MKNYISLPTSNIYEERAKVFLKSRLAERLTKKYKPKPFEEAYEAVYHISLITSYLCNLTSILTGSTFVFTYFFSILEELPYPIVWAFMFTCMILIIIEALQRILTPKLFKNILQFGFKHSLIMLVTIIVTLSSLSIYFSFNGGFDVVSKLTSKPKYTKPILKDIEAVKIEYSTLIEEAANDAKEYKQAKEWKGKLSNYDAKIYKQLLDKKAEVQSKMFAKIEALEAQNNTVLVNTKEAYNEALRSHENSLKSKGGGLALFTIIAQLLFFISIYFIEYFDYKTALQYALLPSSESFSYSDNDYSHFSNGTSENSIENKHEIGFKIARGEQSKNVLQQTKQGKTVLIKDKYTIEHNEKRYTLKDVNNFINIYEKRINDALQENKHELANSRKETLKYWKARKEELLNKIK